MKVIKGFNQDLTCRGYQYEVGKTYEFPDAELCVSGAHAVERPLDVFKYYPPASSVYHECELDDVSPERHSDDSKVTGKKITIGARLSIRNLVEAHIQYTKEHTTTAYTDPARATAGDSGAATAGYRGAATAGYRGAATAGNYGAATAGDSGAATAGNCGAATAGNYGAATAGYRGAATTGDYGAATAGDYGAATAGNSGAATAGDYGAATAGDRGAATSRGKTKVGENGVALARGNNVQVCGGIGAILMIAEENKDNYEIADWKCAVVDGAKIKPDVWYKLVGGEFIEVKEG